MQYNSWIYLIIFLSCTVLLYYILPQKIRWFVLLGASVIFYLLSSRWLIAILAISAVTVYLGARLIGKKQQYFQSVRKTLTKEERKPLKISIAAYNKRIVVLMVVVNFGILFFTKYFNFAGSNLNLLFEKCNLNASIPVLHLLMPLGISFYTLSAVSYLIDVSRETIPAEKNFLKLFLFLIFFPTITEGPICRYGLLGPQLTAGKKFEYRNFCFGLQLILWGLIKKGVVADRLDMYVGSVFDNSVNYSGLPVILAILIYTFQIYMDFSGCIDIVRGSAQLFGITLEENFTRPFFATSVNDFWRRWHITLGAWLRDYIFYPISLGKGFQRLSKASRAHMNVYYASTIPAIIALFAVWFGNGIWHGAEWKYIVYGLYYYIIMVIGLLLEPAFAKITTALHIDRKSNGWKLWQILRTFILVNLGMMIFRAPTLTAAGTMFVSIFHPYTGHASLRGLLAAQGLYISVIGCAVLFVIILIVVGVLEEKGRSVREMIAARPLPLRWSIYILALLVVLVLGAYGPGFGAVDFIYAQF